MPLEPEHLTISSLPRSPLPGGLKPEAAADLLKRAADDYRDALAQAGRLAETVEEQARRIEVLEEQVASLKAEGEAQPEATERPDELAVGLLAAAQRLARERQEEARRESELLLEQAERRAEQLESEVRGRFEGGLSDLEKFEAFREELTAQLRATLEAIVALGGDGDAGDSPPK